MTAHLNLLPALFKEGEVDEFIESRQTICHALSPSSNSLAVFAAPSHSFIKYGSDSYASEQDIYIASWDKPPLQERRVFLTDTSVIFAACRKHIEYATQGGQDAMRSPTNLTTFRKLATDYILHLQDCWVHATQLMSSSNGPQLPGEHYRTLYTSFSLFQLLYLPEDGVEDVPVGDELLEWLNTHFIEPSTEEGDQLSSIERPWEDELFWPYLIRATFRGLLKSSIFFLRSLDTHPSENMQRIAERLIGLLERHPRQRQFTTEKEFFTSARRWKEKAKALRIELDRVPEDDRTDVYENWWDNVSDLVGILEGREDVLQRVCVDLGGGWKEIVCTYGIWIDVGLRRADLPDIVGRTLLNVSLDPTDKEDILHAELCQGRLNQVLAIAQEMDVWLSAHFADIMVALDLLESETDEESGLSIRDQYVLAYASYLHSDPGLWRLTVDYLCTCGDTGKEMADEVLVRVPLGLSAARTAKCTSRGEKNSTFTAMDADDEDERDIFEVVKELNATCYEYGRENARRTICSVAARQLLERKKYGLAVSYCRSAEDWVGLGHIVNSLMDEYIVYGSTSFVHYAAEIAPSIQELRLESGAQGIFIQRLRFAVRYAEFHQRNLQGDAENAALDLVSLFEEEMAPRSWWGVLLYEITPFLQDETNLYIPSSSAYLLLRRLEEVSLRTGQGCGEDYLTILARVLKVAGPKEALKRLEILRLALARYLARCTIANAPLFTDV